MVGPDPKARDDIKRRIEKHHTWLLKFQRKYGSTDDDTGLYLLPESDLYDWKEEEESDLSGDEGPEEEGDDEDAMDTSNQGSKVSARVLQLPAIAIHTRIAPHICHRCFVLSLCAGWSCSRRHGRTRRERFVHRLRRGLGGDPQQEGGRREQVEGGRDEAADRPRCRPHDGHELRREGSQSTRDTIC